MDITPLVKPELKLIQSYGAGFFRVNGVVFTASIFVTGETVSDYQMDELVSSLESHVQALQEQITGQVDVLLIGTGATGRMMPPKQRAALSSQAGCVIEVMDTPSACRTYNVLTAEGRRVAALLMRV